MLPSGALSLLSGAGSAKAMRMRCACWRLRPGRCSRGPTMAPSASGEQCTRAACVLFPGQPSRRCHSDACWHRQGSACHPGACSGLLRASDEGSILFHIYLLMIGAKGLCSQPLLAHDLAGGFAVKFSCAGTLRLPQLHEVLQFRPRWCLLLLMEATCCMF